MEEQSSNKKVITTFGLVTMIITAIFGFGNVSNAYLQMGYGSIIWYALAGICFFFPCGLMMAEYGSTFKEAKGAFTPGWPVPLVNGLPLSGRSCGWHPGLSGWFRPLHGFGSPCLH